MRIILDNRQTSLCVMFDILFNLYLFGNKLKGMALDSWKKYMVYLYRYKIAKQFISKKQGNPMHNFILINRKYKYASLGAK